MNEPLKQKLFSVYGSLLSYRRLEEAWKAGKIILPPRCMTGYCGILAGGFAVVLIGSMIFNLDTFNLSALAALLYGAAEAAVLIIINLRPAWKVRKMEITGKYDPIMFLNNLFFNILVFVLRRLRLMPRRGGYGSAGGSAGYPYMGNSNLDVTPGYSQDAVDESYRRAAEIQAMNDIQDNLRAQYLSSFDDGRNSDYYVDAYAAVDSGSYGSSYDYSSDYNSYDNSYNYGSGYDSYY